MENARPTLIYSDYIACLNERDWTRLGEFVDSDVVPIALNLGWPSTGPCSNGTSKTSPICALKRTVFDESDAMDRAVQGTIRDAATALRQPWSSGLFASAWPRPVVSLTTAISWAGAIAIASHGRRVPEVSERGCADWGSKEKSRQTKGNTLEGEGPADRIRHRA